MSDGDHQSDSDIRRLLESTAEDRSPVLRITLSPRRRIRPAFIALIAVALGLFVGALVAWWHMSR